MTILPKKPKPPHQPPPSQSGAGSGAGAPGGPGGDREASRGEDGGTAQSGQDDLRAQQGNVVPVVSGGGGWGPGGFEAPSPGPSEWASPGGGASPNRWPASHSQVPGGGGSPVGNMVVGGEKRPAPSSVSAYGFDDDDEEDEDDEGGEGVGHGGPTQCQPSASKRSRRSGLGKRLKGSPASGPVCPGAGSPAQGSSAALASRPAVTPSPPLQGCSSWDDRGGEEHSDRGGGGYNSEDEYSHLGLNLTDEEWEAKDRRFEKAMRKKGYVIKRMVDDGSCLFRAVADQVYGDQEMHNVVRSHCMDYILQNSDYFSQYITEDIVTYVDRKRYDGVHGNHLEIQALSEMYNRPIHIFSYGTEPINTFQALQKSDKINTPVRLSYHRETHYNSLVDPFKASIGVGLGLPGHSPGSADRQLMRQAKNASEETLVEKTMLEDKLKHTDWEATNEAIEEQVARESYLQWVKDNERRSAAEKKSATSATVTSGELRSAVAAAHSQLQQQQQQCSGAASPKACCSKHLLAGSPAASKSSSPVPPIVTERGSPVPCSSTSQPRIQPSTSTSGPSSSSASAGQLQRTSAILGLGEDFRLNETESFLNNLPPDMFGMEEWGDRDAILAQVLAASQQEYFESLKKKRGQQQQGSSDDDDEDPAPPPPPAAPSNLN